MPRHSAVFLKITVEVKRARNEDGAPVSFREGARLLQGGGGFPLDAEGGGFFLEGGGAPVKDAKFNASANEIGNIEFFCGDSASFKKRIGGKAKPQRIVVDPPRAGLSKEMRLGLTELSPERIIYVSCNPQTLARDLASLKSSGYEIKRAVPVNMFPLTSHCECVVSLER